MADEFLKEIQTELKEKYNINFNLDLIYEKLGHIKSFLENNVKDCKGCEGLKFCKHTHKGSIVKITKKGNSLTSFCKYKQLEINKNKILPIYVVVFGKDKDKKFKKYDNALNFYKYCEEKEMKNIKMYELREIII